jgi:hypothetical protein
MSSPNAPALEFSLEDQLKCVGREIGQRLKVYQRLVDRGQMSRAFAQREIDTMRAVYATLKSLRLPAPAQPQQTLFDPKKPSP